MAQRVIVLWSGGKDSTLALQAILLSAQYELTTLLTTVTRGYDRVSMHGVRRDLLSSQAKALGLQLEEVLIPQSSSNEQYQRSMAEALSRHAALGTTRAVSGDIFLQDVRDYRENLLNSSGLRGVYPLWKQDTHALARRFIDSGFKAVTTCVDSCALDGSWAGRELDESFFSDLPVTVDPCGENGEFHTFVYDGPLFSEPVRFELGETVFRDNRFYYCDLVPTP